MGALTHLLFAFVREFGGISLLIIGILDSSFLFMPLGNDLLVIALTARHHNVGSMLYFAGMSTVGSILGCLLVDAIFRKEGEERLEKHLPKKRFDYVKRKITANAAWALALASIAPPPFPFTPFIMAASALQYPRKKLLTVVGVVRMIRFTGLGVLALFFGRSIIRWGRQDVVEYSVLGLLIVFVVGSVISVVGWIKHSKQPQPAAEHR